MKYADAPIGICIKKTQIVNELELVWKQKEEKIRSELVNQFQRNLPDEKSKKGTKLLAINKNSVKIYAKVRQSQENEEFWCSYTFMLVHNELLYSGMIYFNCIKKSEKEFDKTVEEILKHISFNDSKYEEQRKECKKKLVGSLCAKDGKIDAIKLANLYSKDVIFNNEDEIKYDGTKHYITGFQLNAALIDKYPDVKENMKLISEDVVRLNEHLELNKNLMVAKNEYHQNFQTIMHGEPITGSTYLFLCAWHMIHITSSGKNKYKVMLDKNLVFGIPNGYSRITEFIKTLRTYNGINDEFEVTYVGVKNFDGPLGLISNPVKDCDQFKAVKIMKSEDINFKEKRKEKIDYSKIKFDTNILKYIHHEIPLIQKELKEYGNMVEKEKKSLEKCSDIQVCIQAILDLKWDNLSLNPSFAYINGAGSFELSRMLKQLKIKDELIGGFVKYSLLFDYNTETNVQDFVNNLVNTLKNLNEDKIKDDFIELLFQYTKNDVELKLSKEKVIFNDIIYDYDKEDKAFQRKDFFDKKNITEDKKNSSVVKKIEPNCSSNKKAMELELKRKQLAEKIKELEENLDEDMRQWEKTVSENEREAKIKAAEEIESLLDVEEQEIKDIERKYQQELATLQNTQIVKSNITIKPVEYMVLIFGALDVILGLCVMIPIVLIIGVICLIMFGTRIISLKSEKDRKYQLKKEEIENNCRNLEKEIEKQKQEIEQKYKEQEEKIMDKWNRKYEKPQSPKFILRMEKRRYELLDGERTEAQKENDSISEEILRILEKYNKPMTITEMQSMSRKLEEVSNQKLSALLTKLCNDQFVTKQRDEKKSYFTFNNQ